ncbi:MAG: hypothetical protein U0X39_08385 [Bacteroidales bacterium]
MRFHGNDCVICNGGHSASEERKIRAGNLEMIYESGSLRYMMLGRTEILRMIYPAFRDRVWITVKPEITEESIVTSCNSFRISYKARYKNDEVDFVASYTFHGYEDGKIVIEMEGEALESFEKNRLGFCVLHPLESCCGKSCVITHPDGSLTQSEFPEEISPHQVFKNISSMTWKAAGNRFTLNFSGDIFETEDQRNWTDASFKTYSTPLSIPYPAKVEKGTKFKQGIEFVADIVTPVNTEPDDTIRIDLFPDETRKLPMIGISRSSRTSPVSEAEMRIIRPLRFDHYRTDLHLFEENWKETALEAAREAEFLSWRIEYGLFFDDNYISQIQDFIDWYHANEPPVFCLLIYHKDRRATPVKLANHVIPVLMEEIPGIRTATGTNINFAQVNRNRPEDNYSTYLCFPVQPQEHATDNKTLIENLKGLKYVAESAAGLGQGRGIWISPVTIKRRFNPNISLYEIPDDPEVFPACADSRMMSLFGAAWTAISLKYLCESDIQGATYFETVGERGIIQGENPSRWPDDFPSEKGMVFPSYFIFKYVLKHKSLKIIKAISSRPLFTDAFVLTDGKQFRMILVNFSSSEKEVYINGCKGMMRLNPLTTTNCPEAISNHHWNCENDEKTSHSGKPVHIEPYSVVFVEGWLK